MKNKHNALLAAANMLNQAVVESSLKNVDAYVEFFPASRSVEDLKAGTHRYAISLKVFEKCRGNNEYTHRSISDHMSVRKIENLSLEFAELLATDDFCKIRDGFYPNVEVR